MNNFEYLLDKYDIEYIKKMICMDLAVDKENDEPCMCAEIHCYQCRFSEGGCSPPQDKKLSWLNSKREPQYKEGDIVLAYEGEILIVKTVYETDYLLVNRLSEPNTRYRTKSKDIQRKVGSINE